MNITLGLRTLAVLALVAASTVVIVRPELIGSTGATAPFTAALAVGVV